MYDITIGYTAGIKPPCKKDCENRCAGCHAKCDAYKSYREKKDIENSKHYEEASYLYERRAYIRGAVEKYKKNHR